MAVRAAPILRPAPLLLVLKGLSDQAVPTEGAVEAAELVATMVTAMAMAMAMAPDADIDASTALPPTAHKSSQRHVTDNV